MGVNFSQENITPGVLFSRVIITPGVIIYGYTGDIKKCFSEGHSESCQTSRVKNFVEIVNGF